MASSAASSPNMASSNTDLPGTIYRWIEKKQLTEAVSWTSREKFWLITAVCHFGMHDWNSVAQVLKNAGELYRPPEWYTEKNCERQFKTIVSNIRKEVKSLPFIDLLKYIAEDLKKDYEQDAKKSKDALKSRYLNLLSIFNRAKQGNLSRNEVVSLYSQAKRNEIEGKQYMDQLMTRQNASLASENSSSVLSEEPIKWNTPSAPLLTSLLRSRNTIPANRAATTIASLLQSPGGTSRTRSGKLLPLTPSIRTTQGTPTLSKLLEAPANPYIPSPPQSTQNNKLSEVGTEKLASTSKKENSQSTLNRARVDNMATLGSFNQINKSDLSASKKQIAKSPVSTVKNTSKENSNVVILLSDSDNDEDNKNPILNTNLKNSFEDKNDTIINRLEPRATRSQTRAEGGLKQLNEPKLSSDGKKEPETLRQQNEGSKIDEILTIDDDDDDDDGGIHQIDVEPLLSDPDVLPPTCKVTRASLQRLRLGPSHNTLLQNKPESKKVENKLLDELSASFVLSATRNVITDEIISDIELVKDAILLRSESQSKSIQKPCNTLTTYDGKLLKQKRIIELKGTNIRCVDSRNDSKLLSFNNQPIVVVNKLKIPFNIKLSSEQINKTDVQIPNMGTKNPIRLLDSSQNVVPVYDGNSSVIEDEVIVIDDDNNTDDNRTNELLSKAKSQNLPSTVVSSNIVSNSKSTVLQVEEIKTKNDKTPWNMFGKTQNILHTTKKQCHQDSGSKIGINSNIHETNHFIKELDFDFDQSISETSLSELYNGVEEIVEMHSFNNEELNSLIECSSLDSNETEERCDTICVDQGDSSVSESDSTIGAFDTFAQITRVQQKSFTPKAVKKLDTRELKTNQGVKDLKNNEHLCQSEEIDDDQSSAVSVTGIPILQGVISDVMSKIDLDRVAALKTVIPHNLPNTDFVEISSDEDVTVNNLKTHHLNVNQNQTQEYKNEKVDGLKKIQGLETNIIKEANNKHVTDTNKPSNTEMAPNLLNAKTCKFNISKKTNNKILEMELPQSKEEIEQKAKQQDVEEMIVAPEVDNVLKEDEEKKVIEITIKIANEKLIKEVERKKKEHEERIKKQEEERKKKLEEETKKKQDEEKVKKFIEEKIRMETEEREKKEILEKEKKELERRKKIEEDIKKKEDEERKTKELEERMKKEEDDTREKEENEKYLNELKTSLDAHIQLNNESFHNRVVVKEELIECEDEYVNEDFIEENIIENNFNINIKEEVISEEDILAEGLTLGYTEEGITEDSITEEGITDECITDECITEEDVTVEGITEEDGTEDDTEEDDTEEDVTDEDSTEYDSTEDDSTEKDSTEEDSTEKDSTEEDCTEEYIYKDTAILDNLNNITVGDFVVKDIKVEYISDEEISDNDLKNIDEYNNQSKSETVFENCKLAKLIQISDCKLQSLNDSISKRIELKKSKRIEDMMNKSEIKKTARDVQVQRGCTELKKQSNVLQTEQTQQLKFNEARKRRIEEIESRKPKSAELKTKFKTKLKKIVELQNVGDIELEKPEEAVLKKATDVELRKNIEKANESEIITLEKKITLKKVKEPPGYNRSVGHTEIDKVKNYDVSPAHYKYKNQHLQTDKNVEQVLIESRKTDEKVDLEKFNQREREIKKSIGSEGKISKGVETKLSEVQIITRTRGLKVELKDLIMSPKIRSQIKCAGSSSSSANSSFVGNSPISSYEYKKQTKNSDDGNKRNSTLNTLYHNKGNLSVHPNVNVTKENLNHETTNIPTTRTRTRTRSASFKQRTMLETRSSKKNQGSNAAIVPKETATTKPLVFAKCPDSQTLRSLMPQNNIFHKHPEFNDGKTLLIPVVMLTSTEIPLHKVHQGTLNFMKHHEIKPTNNQHQDHKPIETPPPKKRGRKRRIDVQNEKLQESNSSNKPTLKNEKTMNTSTIEVEPLAKRTRRSLELRERKKQPVNKKSIQPQKNKKDLVLKKSVQPQKNKNKLLDKSYGDKMNKNVLKFVCNRLYERNKYFSTIEKRMKNITPEQYSVIKTPVELRDTKKKIACGQITTLDQLKVELMTLSNNALMINKSSTSVFSHATNFLSNLIEDCQAFENSISANDDDKSQHEIRTVNYGSNINIVNSDVSEYTHDIIINKKSLGNLHKTHKNTSKEFYGKPQPKNKRKKNTSGSSHSGSDNC